MYYTTEQLPYQATNSFSKIVLDYINEDEKLQTFYSNKATLENFAIQLKEKETTPINRATLVEVLQNDYANIEISTQVKNNFDQLLEPNTFTICTAHQPNIFTGHLYFVYKILHTVKLAATLKEAYPTYNFVPLYYMGSEDADLDELGHINVFGETYTWQTNQKGAVGRMYIDDAFVKLLQQVESTIATNDFGKEIIAIIKKCYILNTTVQQATLLLVNELFGKYGVVVLIADNRKLKEQLVNVFINEIENNTSHQITTATSTKLQTHYKEQAFSRPINLFYLKNDIRERIEKVNEDKFIVVNADIAFTKESLLNEIAETPEHFSPNVILRGLFQETILPNIAFIGGGGELAYWLQLKDIFTHYNTPYPILVLRNSFLLQTKVQQENWQNLGFTTTDLFEKTATLQTIYTKKHTQNSLETTIEKEAITKTYEALVKKANAIDNTLQKHIQALLQKQLNKLTQLDKKLLRAEKKNWEVALNKIKKTKQQLFPNESLQERWDNILPYYAKYGSAIFDIILESSNAIDEEFTITTLD